MTKSAFIVLFTALTARAALPEPPKQHEPWTLTMAEGIPDYVVNVTASVFDAGLADPRGGEYREIELQGGLKTHGWAFGSFAVGWNGLLYSVLSAGAPADLDKDVRTIAGAQPWSGRLALQRDAPPVQTAFWSNMQSVQTIAPLSIALLLRLDRLDLAALLWRAPETPDFGSRLAKREVDEAQWLSTALRSWLATVFWRMIGARERDDDREAVDVGESIISWEPRAKALWKQIPAALPAQFTGASFLWPVSVLLEDSQRRLREPVRPKVDFRALAERLRKDPATSSEFLQKPQAERIAELIDRLEDIRGDKIGWPGPLLYSFDPIYELLTREGEAAIDPLLDAAEHDRRLTRTMDYSRPWYIERAPIPVRDVANLIIRGILELPNRVERSTPAELRAWWGAHKSNDRLGRSLNCLPTTRPRRRNGWRARTSSPCVQTSNVPAILPKSGRTHASPRCLYPTPMARVCGRARTRALVNCWQSAPPR
jgi:hypothetical protein